MVFQTASAAKVGCVAQPRTRFLCFLGKRTDWLHGRDRVRRLGATHPTPAPPAVIPAQAGIFSADRQFLKKQTVAKPRTVGRILVSDILSDGMMLRENVGFENPTCNTGRHALRQYQRPSENPQMRFSDGLLPFIDKIGAAPRGVAPHRAMKERSAIQKTARKT